jgi:hypothetical protein
LRKDFGAVAILRQHSVYALQLPRDFAKSQAQDFTFYLEMMMFAWCHDAAAPRTQSSL